MRVELSSAETTVSTAVTTTPYGSATFASTDGIITDGPGDFANRPSLTPSPSESARFGTLALAAPSGETGVVIGRKGVEFSNSPAAGVRSHEHSRQAPGEQRPAILVRRASTGDDSHYSSDDVGDLYTLDRMAARSVLLTSAHRSSSTDMVVGSPAVVKSKSFVHSDSFSSERFARGVGGGPGTEVGATRRRPLSGRHPPNLGKLGEASSFDANGVAADASDGAEGGSDSGAQTSGIAVALMSPLSSPVPRDVRVHSAHCNGSVPAVAAAAGAGSGSGSGNEEAGVGATRARTERATRSLASLIGLRSSFDVASDKINVGGCTAGVNGSRDARVEEDGARKGAGGEGSISSCQGEAQGEAVEPGARNGAIAQIMVSLCGLSVKWRSCALRE